LVFEDGPDSGDMNEENPLPSKKGGLEFDSGFIKRVECVDVHNASPPFDVAQIG